MARRPRSALASQAFDEPIDRRGYALSLNRRFVESGASPGSPRTKWPAGLISPSRSIEKEFDEPRPRVRSLLEGCAGPCRRSAGRRRGSCRRSPTTPRIAQRSASSNTSRDALGGQVLEVEPPVSYATGISASGQDARSANSLISLGSAPPSSYTRGATSSKCARSSRRASPVISL